jgi:hypothetical protein
MTGVTPSDVIREMQGPDPASRVFVLGCFDRRVTAYSQQVRALNLVFSLHHEKLLSEATRVAVIGGGIAGLTAAAAAIHLKCDVTLLEARSTLLSIQSGNVTRWLHPHIYEWPLAGAEDPNAGLPMLNWHAGSAGDVAEQIESAWWAICKTNADRIQVHLHAFAEVQGQPSAPTVRWNVAEGGFAVREFDVVFVAAGFGIETSAFEGVAVKSYWRNDDLDQPELEPPSGKKVHFLVSGRGDGGLVDLLRVRLTNFRHDRLVRLLGPTISPKTKARILEIEGEARRRADGDWFLWKSYGSLDLTDLISRIKSQLRLDTTGVLVGESPSPLAAHTSILNRLLCYALLTSGAGYEQGRIVKIDREAGRYRVELQGGRELHCDRIVLRHGPTPCVAKASQLAETWRSHMTAIGTIDQTRRPMWTPATFFGSEATPVITQDSLTISFNHPLIAAHRVLQIPRSTFRTVQDLLDFIYAEADGALLAYSYGVEWVLRDITSQVTYQHVRTLIENPPADLRDGRSLKEAGIPENAELEVIPAVPQFIPHEGDGPVDTSTAKVDTADRGSN